MKLWGCILWAAWAACQSLAADGGVPAPGATPGAPPAVTPAPAPDAAPGWERYQVVVKNNIFSKTRGEATRPPETKKEAPPPPTPESELVLTGILQRDGQLLAFVENTKTGAVQVVHKDDPVARGKVTAITFESIEYVRDGTSVNVGTGMSLEGRAAGGGSASPVPASNAPDANPASAETNAILERLRRRRLEEMKR